MNLSDFMAVPLYAAAYSDAFWDSGREPVMHVVLTEVTRDNAPRLDWKSKTKKLALCKSVRDPHLMLDDDGTHSEIVSLEPLRMLEKGTDEPETSTLCPRCLERLARKVA